MWREFRIDDHLWNESLGATRQVEYKPLFEHIWPIYPGFRWDLQKNCLVEDRFTPSLVPMDIDKFLGRCEKYFDKYKDKKIGVHLSGGLDSSLIIGILHHLDIPFYLFGLYTDRYEFRTERKIQEILAPLGIDTVLINNEDYPFYSCLDKIPAKQFPDGAIKANESAKAIALACKEKGIQVVFGGQGGDTLFVDETPLEPGAVSYNIGNEFDVSEESDLIYAPLGIELKSFYADKSIIEAIYNLRLGQKEDVWKDWARKYFRDFLPKELSEYHYVADFFGISMSGLEAAKPTIKKLFEKAYELLRHEIFSPISTEKMLTTNVFAFDFKMYIDFLLQDIYR